MDGTVPENDFPWPASGESTDDSEKVPSRDESESLVQDVSSPLEDEHLSALGSYLKKLQKSHLLTFEEEQNLGRRIRDGDENARQKRNQALHKDAR